MKHHLPIRLIGALLSISACCVSCDSGGAALFNGGSNPGTDGASGDATDSGNLGRPNPFDGALGARVRNESSARVDVTMRFIRADSVVHLAFLRVPPATITSVTSPQMAELVELSGVDESGRALESASFKYGVDFDERTPAEYVVVNRNDPNVPTNDPIGSLRLSLIEPASDTTVTLGSALRVRWDDGGAGPSALVRLFLRLEGATTASSRRVQGPAIGAGLDGINDEFALVIQDVTPGRYELVAELSDGDRSVLAIAPGRIVVGSDAANRAPKISITEPTGAVERYADESLNVVWTDADADDNATISFSLERPQTATATGGSFRIGPPVAEDPDGRSADSLTLSLTGVLPGLYDLVATIDDGALKGVDRIEDAVRVLPALTNDPPSLVLLAPAQDKLVLAGGTFQVRWSDSDDNDNARISFLIDSNWSRVDLGGGERLLLSGVNEDDDNGDGSATLTIPSGVTAGKYRIIGVITDGMTQVITRAPGFLFVEGDPTVNVAGGGNTGNGNGSDTGNNGSGNEGTGDTGSGDENVADGGGTGDGGNTGNGDGAGTGDTGGNGDTGNGNGDSGTGGGNDTGGSGDTGGGDTGGNDTDPPDVVVVDPPDPVRNERTPIPADEVAFDIAFIAQSSDTPAGLTITNVPYGGTVQVEMDIPSGWDGTTQNVLTQLNIPLGAIPNSAWPRSFDLVVSYVVDGTEQKFVWPRPIQIPQLVEVNFAALGETLCASEPARWLGPQRFNGLQVGWFGGGTSETTGQAHVEFWLSRDGLVPDDGQETPGHRLVYSGLGSPNEYRLSQVDLLAVIMGGVGNTNDRAFDRDSGTGHQGMRSRALAPGEYSLITVADYGPLGRIVSRPDLHAINVCSAAVNLALND